MKHYFTHWIVPTLILMTVLSTLLLSTISDKQSTSAIASYNNFIAPKIRITRQYDPKDANRFHLNPDQYIKTRYVTYRRRVTYRTKPDQLTTKLHMAKNILNQVRDRKRASDRARITTNRLLPNKAMLNEVQTAQRQVKRLQNKIAHTPDVYRKRVVKARHKVVVSDITYQVKPIANHKIVYLHPNYPIWYHPYRPHVGLASTTNLLAKDNQAMNIIGKAQAKNHTFYEVKSGGYTYGWVPKQAVKVAHSYQIPFHYYSQMKPLKAPDACEAVSLWMALSSKGYDPRISMRDFINRIPRSKDPNKGYTANPYHYGDDASIYPKALAKYGRRYDPHVYAMKDVSLPHLVKEIEEGNPVVYEGSYRMENIDSEHVLVLVGYSNGDLEFADPFCRKSDEINNKPISWVSLKKFAHLFHQRGARAVVIK
ncbi:C39 family peptidase [Acetilactobacillus jinshanensis]|uniref:Peptidase C39-like domain-containing protein n=1 Tax=Acetilactobacillus jinshanensis TaxID=1720083 RepID=A0A4P6ZKR1_9LACO|nr:C39 family peptidase [Acetilactobacillus jinshanensis]QBP18284.1 hypothetical protein ELX58_03850 [Acetilactobacillus jinshanensis]URL61148.1 hypothetical protein HGK75_03905 [uncultured bacterium]